MPKEYDALLNTLESFAAYTGSWTRLLQEKENLCIAIEDIKTRLQGINSPLIVAIVGGTGVGKSTLLNALAGAEIAEVSPIRPHTSTPTVYHPHGYIPKLDCLPGITYVPGSPLKNIVLIDTPDWDSTNARHCETALEVLRQCDLILLCADAQKYLVDKTRRILAPLKNKREIVCVQTQVDSDDPAVRKDWQRYMEQEGFSVRHYFPVNALNAWNRIVAGRAEPVSDEYEFSVLKNFLAETLDLEYNRKIKEANLFELLNTCAQRLYVALSKEKESLLKQEKAILSVEQEIKKRFLGYFIEKVFSCEENWETALTQEIARSGTGIIGTVFKWRYYLTSLPDLLSHLFKPEILQNAPSDAGSLQKLINEIKESETTLPDTLKKFLAAMQRKTDYQMKLAGFSTRQSEEARVGYKEYFKEISRLFAQKAQDNLIKCSKLFSSKYVKYALDSLPWMTILLSILFIIKSFYSQQLLSVSALLHLTALFVFVVFFVLKIFNWVIASFSKKMLKDVRKAIEMHSTEQSSLLERERALIRDALRLIEKAETLMQECQEAVYKES